MRRPNIASFAPVGWHSDPSRNSVVVRAYRVMLVNPKDVRANPFTFDVGGVRGVLIYGMPDYFAVGPMVPHVSIDGKLNLVVEKVGKQVLPPGWYMILFAPFAETSPSEKERAWRNIDDAEALLANIHGRNILYERVFNTQLRLDKEQQTATSPPFRNPDTYAPLCCSPANFEVAEQLARAMAAAPSEISERTSLSLRWFRESLEADGVDAMGCSSSAG